MLCLLHVLITKVDLTFKKDVFSEFETCAGPLPRGVSCVIECFCHFVNGRFDWGGTVVIIDSQVIVEGALVVGCLVEGAEATGRGGDVGVTTTTIVNVVYSLGMDVGKKFMSSLLTVIEGT